MTVNDNKKNLSIGSGIAMLGFWIFLGMIFSSFILDHTTKEIIINLKESITTLKEPIPLEKLVIEDEKYHFSID